MNYLTVDNYDIPYQIEKKKNKNTYFYFRKEGYIQINLSRYQSKKVVLNYIKEHSDKFINKLKSTTTEIIDPTKDFLLLGTTYTISIHDLETLNFDTVNKVVYTPTSDINNPIIKDFYKQEMMSIINDLSIKYMDNPYIDISNIVYQTRYTTSRHGSCNAKKRKVNLNLNLIKYDPKFIEYVYLHEITHLTHQNHGPNFYDLFRKLCPNYKELKKEFKNIYRW